MRVSLFSFLNQFHGHLFSLPEFNPGRTGRVDYPYDYESKSTKLLRNALISAFS